jgi:RNA polymerase sigma-70 factor (ECF subfamily)
MSRQHRKASEGFPPTNWSIVRAAGAEPAEDSRPALSALLDRYWPVLCSHLVHRKGVPVEAAEDLVQSFIEKKVLQRNLVQAADPARGRFRTFLLTALDRFWIDWRRSAAGPPASELGDDAPEDPDADVFDVAWALRVVIESFRRTRLECIAKERPELWGVLVGRVLAPLIGAETLTFHQLAERHGLLTEKQAANRYITAEAMFQRNFRDELAEYATDVEQEALDFRRILSEAGAELVERLRIELWKDLPEVTHSFAGAPAMGRGAIIRLLELPPAPDDFAAQLRKVLATRLPSPSADSPRPFLGDLLSDPGPPLELLEQIKDFAKESRTDPESPLSPAVATIVYYAAIAAALLRRGERISRQDDATLKQGFQWCDRPWVEDWLRVLFNEAAGKLNPQSPLSA